MDGRKKAEGPVSEIGHAQSDFRRHDYSDNGAFGEDSHCEGAGVSLLNRFRDNPPTINQMTHSFNRSETGKPLVFSTTTYLVSEEKEMEFLRKISEIIVIFLLPKGYSMAPLKNLLSELISYKSE